MIVKTYILEDKDKEVLTTMHKYCKSFNTCHGCMFDKSNNRCILQEVIVKASIATDLDYNALIEKIKKCEKGIN